MNSNEKIILNIDKEVEKLKSKVNTLSRLFVITLLLLIASVVYFSFQNTKHITEENLLNCNLENAKGRITFFALNYKTITNAQILQWVANPSPSDIDCSVYGK